MTTAELLLVLKAQHSAIDQLLAMIVMLDSRFIPSKSGQPWDALVAGNYAIHILEAGAEQPSFECPTCHAVSFNPNDVKNSYCVQCHAFTRDEAKR